MKTIHASFLAVVAATLALFLSAPPAQAVPEGSALLSEADVAQLSEWLGEGPVTLTKIFSSTPGDGQTSADFHAAADGQGRTLTVIELPAQRSYGRKVIGGYNPQSWESAGYYHDSGADAERTAFLFNLTTATRFAQKLGAEYDDPGVYQTYNVASYGPTFGGGHDLQIASDLHSGYGSQFSYGPGLYEGFDGSIAGGGQGSEMVFGTVEVFTIGIPPVNAAPVVAVDGSGGAGDFSAAGSLATARYYHTASVLADGRVLVAGGNNGFTLGSAELYQPASNTWTAAGSLGTARYYHTASVLADGRVLATGGDGENGRVGRLASAEIYDPASDTWTPTGSLTTARDFHTATVLGNGKVLVAGGNDADGVLASAELYDPANNTWTVAGSLATAREYHTANVLADGKVLVTGGNDGNGGLLASAELYDPVSNTWTAVGNLLSPRSQHTATVLADGRVLVVAGSAYGPPRRTAELYDPATRTWTAAGSLSASGYRYLHTASLLADGRVLVAGGSGNSLAISSAELYDPATNVWTEAGTLARARFLHKASMLANGKVLVTGGSSGSVAVDTAELYGSPAVVTTAAEGSAVTQTGTFSDADGNETVVLTASSGTMVQDHEAGTWTLDGDGGRRPGVGDGDDHGDGWGECVGDGELQLHGDECGADGGDQRAGDGLRRGAGGVHSHGDGCVGGGSGGGVYLLGGLRRSGGEPGALADGFAFHEGAQLRARHLPGDGDGLRQGRRGEHDGDARDRDHDGADGDFDGRERRGDDDGRDDADPAAGQ